MGFFFGECKFRKLHWMQQENHAIKFYTQLRHMKIINLTAELVSFNFILDTISVIFNLEAETDLFLLNILAKP